MRFAITARAVARRRSQGIEMLNETALLNVRKVTQFRKNGVEELEKAIANVKLDEGAGVKRTTKPAKSA